MTRVNVFLTGKHANRTPMAYSEYKQIFRNFCNFVSRMEDADIVVLGFSVDLNGLSTSLQKLKKNREIPKILIISEEPLWDTLSGNDFRLQSDTFYLGGEPLKIWNFNHFTSDIFKFHKIPYFLTTESCYFSRYASLLSSRSSSFDSASLKLRLKSSQNRIVFLAQYRDEQKYEYKDELNHIYGLSIYRTQLALLSKGQDVSISGEGWNEVGRRQLLTDWHIDKLFSLSDKVQLLSAIENVHDKNYITEKFFDAFIVGAIPIYLANPSHRIFEFTSSSAFINLWGKSPSESCDLLNNFKIDDFDFFEYEHTLNRLKRLFSNQENLHEERARVVWECMKAICDVANS
ncbi:glycosyltransferase family 10 [Alteromonas ponticola]|uniref:Glycosyltransferase family 10 n=1 Tax=Alteromonas aquimaris TaxID=2998417 RepID=A0ABT3P5K9_9ALTE|nr:glycosyltransferase family 10 [Alteromonas aquimaris]MCW8108056.1 glycosyltransferase family 10 [Alteromonas aquimaris]